MSELAFGTEIKGVVCPECGGSLVRNKGKVFCYEDGFVRPVKETPLPFASLSDDEQAWLDEHQGELEPEID